VTAVSLHPGAVATDLWRNRGQDVSGLTKFYMPVLNYLISWFGLSTAEGAKTTIYCATSEDVPKNNGKYFA
jgi:retinol dehydrogenase-12